MASSRFQLISKKLVKPSLSTPPSLRNYKLSILDQLDNRFIPMTFFYPNQQQNHSNNTNHTSSLLEESLSKTLSSYYPFAGRLTDNISVTCNDAGATFLEARVKFPMSEILNTNDASVQDLVYPNGLPWSTGHDDQHSLMVAQLNHFDCGGKALSVCLKHNIADGHTLCNFIHDWAAMARNSSEKPSPQFIGASILPPIDDLSFRVGDLEKGKNCITKRFKFDSENLSKLKKKAVDESGVANPTRVEVVSALLYKCGMSASMLCSGTFKPSGLYSMLNLRPLIGPQNYAGNFLAWIIVHTTNEKEINFARLVSETRREKVKQYEKYRGITPTRLLSTTLEMVEQVKRVQSGLIDIDIYPCSSLCRFPMNDIDFGWGSPVMVSVARSPSKFFILMDNRNGDGIEALVILEEEVMSVFQSDPDILAFASTSSF